MMYGWDGGWHMGWMGLGWLLLAILVAVVAWGTTRLAQGTHRAGSSPREVLKMRYAKGEIDRDTYERMLRDLDG